MKEDLIGPVRCNGRFGYLTPAGNFTIDPAFEELGECSEGLVSYRIGERVGFLSLTGSVAIPPRFEDGYVMPVFRSGLAAVRSNGQIGYIDRSGDWRISPSWSLGWNFKEQFALAESREGHFVIDQKGQVVTRLDVWDVARVPDLVTDWACFRCLFSLKPGIGEGAVNWRGEVVFPPDHARITDFYNGVAGFTDEDDHLGAPFGLVSFSGEILRQPQYLDLDCFSDGLARAAQTLSARGRIENYGYVDLAGEWIIPPRFWQAFQFREGLARVAIGGAYDRFREIVEKPKFGFTNRKGDVAIAPVFSSAGDFRGGFAVVERDDNSIVIDQEGHEVWKGPR